jgi:other hect domain ubiquitin protein ligase E3
LSKKETLSSEEDGYIQIHLPKTISAFLATARGITFSSAKNNLIKEIISHSEFNEELIEIPTFKFERLNVASNQERQVNMRSKKAFDSRIALMNEFDADNEIKQNEEEELHEDESLFLQAFQQGKSVDPAFFRSKKIERDHTGFKVEFSGELVQGISGPYRQIFSDISIELQEKDIKNKRALKLLHPSSNNLASRGEYKDKFTLNPSYNSSTALSHSEFLGVLMGICIRTGVYLTIDLCSIIWKKLVNIYIIKLITDKRGYCHR